MPFSCIWHLDCVEVVCFSSVKEFVWLNHANAHGIFKGSTTFIISGTTVPPSVPSVANCGDWSMGAVLDVYWTFSDAGDYFLGRVLAGLDPNKSEFATMPPHFIVEGNLLDDLDIYEAMYLMYGPILNAYNGNDEIDPRGLLLIILASVVYHSDWLLDVVSNNPGHQFSLIPILNNQDLLN